MPEIDWDKLEESLRPHVETAITAVLKGVGADVKQFAMNIVADFGAIESDPHFTEEVKTKLRKELYAQIRLMGEAVRVTGTNESWYLFQVIVKGILESALAALLSVLLR